MKSELEQELLRKYPEFFEHLRDYNGPIIPIQFGIECGDGWFWILDNLMGDIQSYTKCNQRESRPKNKLFRWYVNLNFNRFRYKYMKPFIWLRRYIYDHAKIEQYDKFSNVQITQIKEKFGGLRFYYDGGDKMIDGMTWLAESMSYNMCENCGSTKNVKQRGRSWVYTACDKCERKTNKHTT